MFSGFLPSRDAGIQAIFSRIQEESLLLQPLEADSKTFSSTLGTALDLMSSSDFCHQVLDKPLSSVSLPYDIRQPLEPVPS